MVYNKATYTGFIAESAIPVADDVCTDPLQFCIEAAETDHKLFEALITVDFTEAANTKGDITLSESDLSYMVEAAEEGIIAKLKALIAKFKEAMKNVITKFLTFVSNLAANDKKIYEKYKKDVVSAKVKDCDLKGEVVNTANYDKACDLVNDNLLIAGGAAKNTEDLDNSKKAVAEMEKNLEELKKIIIIDTDVLLNSGNVDDMAATVGAGYKKLVDSANNSYKQTENIVKNGQLEAEEAQRDAKTKKDTARANKAYEAISKVLSLSSATMSVFMTLLKRRIAVNRSNFIKLGNWVAKGGKKETATKEAAYDEAYNMLIDIVSDSYCESAWEEA